MNKFDEVSLRYVKRGSKTCWIVAGPNGAGKSTLAKKYLPNNCVRYLNADHIARNNNLDATTAKGLILAGRTFYEDL